MCTRGSLTLAEINETFSDQAVKVEAEWRFSVWIKWLGGGRESAFTHCGCCMFRLLLIAKSCDVVCVMLHGV